MQRRGRVASATLFGALLVAGCRTSLPVADAGRAPTGVVFGEPRLGLHAVLGPDASDDRPTRSGFLPLEGARAPRALYPARASVPAPASGAPIAPGSPPPPAARGAGRIERPLQPNPLDVPLSETDGASRFGRGYASAFSDSRRYEFLRFRDLYLPSNSESEVLSEALRSPGDDEERDRYVASAFRRALISPLRGGVRALGFVGPFLWSLENLPDEPFHAMEDALGWVAGDDEGPDLGDLELRTKGGILRSPSRWLSLRYRAGPVRVDLFPTRAKARCIQHLGPLAALLEAKIKFFEPERSVSFGLERSLGADAYFRLLAGTGVDAFDAPGPFAWPGDEGDTGYGAIAYIEKRF